MKASFLSVLLLLFFACASSAQSKDEKEVADAVEQLRKALIDGTEGPLRAITAEELSYGHSTGKVENQQQFIDDLVKKESDFKSITLIGQTIKVVGNTAIVRHILDAETMDYGKPGTVKIGILLIFQKRDSQWKLLARQAYKLK
jgi:hypothetical protein